MAPQVCLVVTCGADFLIGGWTGRGLQRDRLMPEAHWRVGRSWAGSTKKKCFISVVDVGRCAVLWGCDEVGTGVVVCGSSSPFSLRNCMVVLILEARPELNVAICSCKYIRKQSEVYQPCFLMVAVSTLLRQRAIAPPAHNECELTMLGKNPCLLNCNALTVCLTMALTSFASTWEH